MAARGDHFAKSGGSVDWSSVASSSQKKKKIPESKEASPKTCNFGATCTRIDCEFSHPKGRKEICPDGKCADPECFKVKLHSKECYQAFRQKQLEASPRQECKHGSECCNFNCHRVHPEGYPGKCQWGAKCSRFGCRKVHPKERTQDCRFGANCKSLEKGSKHVCHRVHPGKQKKVEA